MTNPMEQALETMGQLVTEKEKELAELKRAVNTLCRQVGRPEVYPDAAEPIIGGLNAIRPDQYYGKSPTVAAREYIEARGEAVPAEEIVDALERGGFDFDTQGWKKTTRLRNLSIAMSKNSAIFHRLPNGTYGLVKFYPDVEAEKKKKRPDNGGDDNGDELDVDDSGKDGKGSDEATVANAEGGGAVSAEGS